MSGDGGERVRLFVALDLPEPVRAGLARWRAPVLLESDALRPVAQGALHVTLCFLGSKEAGDVPAIASACAAAVVGSAAPAEIALEAGVWLPPRRPRVLAVRLSDPSGEVAAAQEAVSDALSAGGWYTPEKRPFLPHVTVARVAARARLRPPELPPLPPLSFRAPTVTLYRSRLQRTGARYEPLASVALAPGG